MTKSSAVERTNDQRTGIRVHRLPRQRDERVTETASEKGDAMVKGEDLCSKGRARAPALFGKCSKIHEIIIRRRLYNARTMDG